MPGFDGTGPNGMGSMTGGGRGLCNTGRPGMRMRALPRGRGYGFRRFVPRVSREQELDYLKRQADALRTELKELETEIEQMGSVKDK